jgi:uncharacterized protein (DUF488 family)
MQHDAPDADLTVLTIGHSNHSLKTFLGLLEQHRIEIVIDVRSYPCSGYASHFDKDDIQQPLRAQGIRYLFLGDALGGRPDGRQVYDSQGHVLYDRVAATERFQAGIERLLRGAAACRLVVLCGEEDPTGCHRRLLVGRVLAERGVRVLHIRSDGRVQTEQEVADQEEFQRTGGQKDLFDTREPDQWKSTRSVSPRKAPPNSSGS